MSNIIYYFSGTGNSFAISRQIANKLEGTELAPIMHICNHDIEKHDVIGLVFPVYYLHAPEIVIRTLKGIEFKRLQRVFTIAVYAGSWGYALSDVRHELEKNKDIDIQEFRVRMPGNHILEYGAFPHFYQEHIINKAMKQIDGLIDAIRHNKTTGQISPNLLAKLFKHNGDKIKTFGESGTKFRIQDSCQHCGTCLKICPVKNIVDINGRLVWGDKCQRCMACIQWCPNNAISHPDLKEKRIRYTCPGITYQELWSEQK